MERPDLPAGVFPLARQHVLGEGRVPSSWMFVAEAPGRQEDYAGRPLIGPTGSVFNKLLEQFTQLRRPDVYVTNVVKDWPGPGNPTPKVGQVKPYLPYLHWELQTVQPKVIVAMGAVAVKVFDAKCRVKADHGLARHVDIPGVWSGTVVPWYHPAFAIRNPSMMPVLIADAQRLHDEVGHVDQVDTPSIYQLIHDPHDAACLLLGKWGEFGFDTETTSPTHGHVFATDEADMVGFSVSFAQGTGLYVPTYEVGTSMAAVLESPLWTKLCHNAKFEYKILAKQDVHMVGWEDTKIAAYLLGESRTGLKDLTKQYLGHVPVEIRELWPEGIANQPKELARQRYEDFYEYGAADPDNTRQLWAVFKPRLVAEGLWPVYEIEKTLMPVLAEMERVGMAVDEAKCEEVQSHLFLAQEKARATVYEVGQLSPDFNIGSPDQLESLLVKLGAPMQKLTKSKKRFSTSADVLDELQPWWPEFLQPLLAYRKYGKMYTYVTGFLNLRGPDGRLHTSFNQSGHWEEAGANDPATAPATGRLSSSGPNLMNIPHHRATVEGYDWAVDIRACLVTETPACPSCKGLCGDRAGICPTCHGTGDDDPWVLMSVDLGQEEPRIVATLAQDETLLEGFRNGQDIYRPATEALYPGTKDDSPDRDWALAHVHERFVGKTFFLAWYYGAAGKRLLILDPTLTQSDVKRGLALLTEAHPARGTYLDEVRAQLQDHGYVTSLYGRRRRLPKAWSPRKADKEEALREGANDRVQATAADILKIAMPKIHRRLRDGRCLGRLISTVHDEVVLEMPAHEVDHIRNLVAACFQDLLPGLTLEVEASIGRDWGHMERI